MIGLSRVGSDIKDLSHFRAETSRYLAPYFEHFQAFPELQILRRKTSRCWPEVSEGPKSISNFISEFSHLIFIYFLMVISTDMASPTNRVSLYLGSFPSRNIEIWSRFFVYPLADRVWRSYSGDLKYIRVLQLHKVTASNSYWKWFYDRFSILLYLLFYLGFSFESIIIQVDKDFSTNVGQKSVSGSPSWNPIST